MCNRYTPQTACITVVLLSIIVMAGCKTQHVAYHSTADVPYFTEATTTNMELIVGDEAAARNRDYRVVVATDDQQLSYVLIAPRTGSSIAEYSFENTNLHRAVPIQRSNLNALIAGLARTLEFWDGERSDTEGDFFEFVHAPEQDVRRVSENVVEWRAALQFTFSYTSEGPAARILLGDSPEETLQHVITFDEREDVEDFRLVLQLAREQMQAMASR